MRIEFRTNNDAFSYDASTEIIRILENICNKVAHGKTYGSVVDINGNTVGEWEI